MKRIVQQMSDGTFRRKQKDAPDQSIIKELLLIGKNLELYNKKTPISRNLYVLKNTLGSSLYIMKKVSEHLSSGNTKEAKKIINSLIGRLVEGIKNPELSPEIKKVLNKNKEQLKNISNRMTDTFLNFKQKDASPGFKQKRKVGDATPLGINLFYAANPLNEIKKIKTGMPIASQIDKFLQQLTKMDKFINDEKNNTVVSAIKKIIQLLIPHKKDVEISYQVKESIKFLNRVVRGISTRYGAGINALKKPYDKS